MRHPRFYEPLAWAQRMSRCLSESPTSLNHTIGPIRPPFERGSALNSINFATSTDRQVSGHDPSLSGAPALKSLAREAHDPASVSDILINRSSCQLEELMVNSYLTKIIGAQAVIDIFELTPTLISLEVHASGIEDITTTLFAALHARSDGSVSLLPQLKHLILEYWGWRSQMPDFLNNGWLKMLESRMSTRKDALQGVVDVLGEHGISRSNREQDPYRYFPIADETHFDTDSGSDSNLTLERLSRR
ncbi:hypothetical protein C8J56DRAFT_1048435 [Mycena floridula]|nr:hypothetical protein C8J56DRAFT_1048435 [Mycena floridula]